MKDCPECEQPDVLRTRNRAEELREQAAYHEQAREESFERCDTDGFVSQWAHGINAEKARRQAEIEESGGMAEFPGLFDGERRVNAKRIPTKYGRAWLLADSEEERYGRRFVPCGENSRVQRQLGLEERPELAPAMAVIRASGTGLAGAASAYVAVIRTDIRRLNDGTNDD